MHHAITDRWADLTGLVWVLPSTSTFDLTCYEWAFRGRCSQRVLFSQPVKQNPPVGTKGPVNQTATWEAPQRGYCARVKTFILPATTTPTPPAAPECWHSNSQTPSHQSLLELCSNSNSLASFVNFFFTPEGWFLNVTPWMHLGNQHLCFHWHPLGFIKMLQVQIVGIE